MVGDVDGRIKTMHPIWPHITQVLTTAPWELSVQKWQGFAMVRLIDLDDIIYYIYIYIYGYGSIPIHTIFRGMNIHLPAILMFTRGIGFWPIPILINQLELISGHFRPLWVVTPTFATFFPPFSHLLKKCPAASALQVTHLRKRPELRAIGVKS